MLGAVPVPAAAAEPDDLAVGVDGNADIARLALDDGAHPIRGVAPTGRQETAWSGSGIGSPPGLNIEAGDAAGIAGACGTDRDRAHGGLLCRFSRIWGGVTGRRKAAGNALRWTPRASALCSPYEASLVVCSRRARSGGAPLDRCVAGAGGQSQEGAGGSAGRRQASHRGPGRSARSDRGRPMPRETSPAGSATWSADRKRANSAGVARKAPVAMVTHRPSESIH